MSEEKSIEELLKRLAMEDDSQKPKPMDEYKFWKTQPVPHFEHSVDAEGPLQIKSVSDVPQEPYKIHDSFEWCTLDLDSDADLDSLYTLLFDHYVEDHDAAFRFAYSREFFNWALKPPGWKKEWHIGVRVKDNGKLVGFIGGVPCDLDIRDKFVKSVEINFLCVHKQLRSKRMAPLMIKEMTRRVNLHNIWQALYTSGTILPKPIATCRYMHRPINWDNLYKFGFSMLPPNESKESMVAKYAMAGETKLKGWRAMTEADVNQVWQLYEKFRKRYAIGQAMSKEESRHWFLGGEFQENKKIHTFVVEDSGKISDFISFYVLPFTVLKSNEELGVAYLYYYGSESAISGSGLGLDDDEIKRDLKKRLKSLVHDAIIEAKRLKVDVFNALTAQDNHLFVDDMKFGAGDGYLNYYLFNYKVFPMKGGCIKETGALDPNGSDVGVVLL
ncbi:glycylpeptide N-tetradecanoyltransferase [Martiniozyma asiatica (nom. inval.)]|nr:glycylpeptide N-tetradecanoyltransferase [Martiniozyma asiatica]